jgi:hypothetical protein
MGNQVVGNASHLIDALGQDTQAFALDKSIRIKNDNIGTPRRQD